MVLGGYVFQVNPANVPGLIAPSRRSAAVLTLGGVAHFSWGVFYPGKAITLKWPYMPAAMYEVLLAFYVADASLTWDPQDGSGKTFTVEIGADFPGSQSDYHLTLQDEWGDGQPAFRLNVEVPLIITAELT
jgi:hypothetical protein